MEQQEAKTLEVIAERLEELNGTLRDLVELQKRNTVEAMKELAMLSDKTMARIERLENDGDRVARPNAYTALQRVGALEDRADANEQAVAQMMEALEEYSGQVVRLLTGKPKEPARPAGIPHDDPMDGE